MKYRRDAGYAAARIIGFARELTRMIEGQVANAGQIAFEPGNVNVVPRKAVFTMDIRNPDDLVSPRRSGDLREFAAEVAREERVTISTRDSPASRRYASTSASSSGRGGWIETGRRRRMVSGAGHEARRSWPRSRRRR